MGLLLNKVFDPRDNLAKARRPELYKFAQENGVSDIKENMPAELMRRILRSRGVTHIRIGRRMLGVPDQMNAPIPPSQMPQNDENVQSIDATDDLMRQWEAQQRAQAETIEVAEAEPPSRDDLIAEMKVWELRKACKANGVAIKQTDKAADMRAKLKAKLNGEIAFERSQ